MGCCMLIVSGKFLEPFRLRHVAPNKYDVTSLMWGCSDLRWWLDRATILNINRPIIFGNQSPMYYWCPTTHTATGLHGNLFLRLRTSNKETMVFIGHVTDQDEIRPTKLWSVGLPPNIRNITEHVHKAETAGEAYPIRSQLAGIKCHLTRI